MSSERWGGGGEQLKLLSVRKTKRRFLESASGVFTRVRVGVRLSCTCIAGIILTIRLFVVSGEA